MASERDPRAVGLGIGLGARRVARALAGLSPGSRDPEYRAWLALRTPAPAELDLQARGAAALPWQPSLDLVLKRRPGDEVAAERTLASLERQTYRRFERLDAGPSVAIDAVVERGRGDLVLPLESGDELAPQALHAIAASGAAPADLLYSDEDRLRGAKREAPLFKSGWSPEALLSHDAVGGLKALRRELVLDGGGLGQGEHALLLRLLPSLRTVRHLPDVLLHRREDARAPDGATASRAVMAYADGRLGSDYEVTPGTLPRLRYLPAVPPRVAVIVPTRDGPELLETCLRGLANHPNHARLEVLLVDNGTTDAKALALLTEASRRRTAKVLRWPGAFNWSAVNNGAARKTDAEYLLFMNNDVEAEHAGWLDAMLAFASLPDVGCVGAQLLYPDCTLQHYGVVVGMTGFAGHLLQGAHVGAPSRCGRSDVVRNCSAVTGACLLVRREVFERLGGFDESFILCGSDVALGLRAMEAGLRNVVTPQARLLHGESKTRGHVIPPSDFKVSLEVYRPWLEAGDPYYNPNLSLRDTRCRLRLAREDMLDLARRIAG